MKLSHILMTVFLVLGLFGSLIFVSYSHYKTEKSLENYVGDKLRNTVKLELAEVESFLEEKEKVYYQSFDEELFVRFLRLSPEDEKYNETLEETLILFHNSSLGAGLTNSEGIVVSGDEEDYIGLDFSETPIIKKIIAEGEAYSTYPELEPSKIGMGYGKSIYDPKTGDFLGTWGVEVPLYELNEFLGQVDELSETEESYLINEDFLLLTPSRFLRGESRGVLAQVIDTENSRNCLSMGQMGEHKNHEEITPFLDYRGEETIGAHEFIPKVNWCLLVEIEKEEVIDTPLKENIKRNLLISILVILILTSIGFFIGKYFDKKNKRKKNKKYPCGIHKKSQPLHCKLMGGKCETYPNGRCGKIIKTRNFFINLKLRYYFLFALIFTIGYFFLVTSFFQGWQNAKFFDDIPDLLIFIVGFMIFVYGLKIKNIEARKFIILGGLLICIRRLFDIPFQEYQVIVGHLLTPFLWVPVLIAEFTGFLLLLIGYRRLKNG